MNVNVTASWRPAPQRRRRSQAVARDRGRRHAAAPASVGNAAGMRSKPQWRPTSSMRSASRPTSTRKRGTSDAPAFGCRRQPEAQRLRESARRPRPESAEPSRRASLARHAGRDRFGSGRADTESVMPPSSRPAPIAEQRRAPARARPRQCREVGAALETRSTLPSSGPVRGSWPGRRRENQALSSAMRVVLADTSEPAPPMTPATATGRSRSAMTSIVSSSVRVAPSSVDDLLAGARTPHVDLRTGQLRDVKRVHRMPHFEHHVVGDVHDVVDRRTPAASRRDASQSGRWADRDVGDRERVAAAARIAIDTLTRPTPGPRAGFRPLAVRGDTKRPSPPHGRGRTRSGSPAGWP